MLDCRGLRSNQLVAENSNVRSAEPQCQVNEAPRIGKLLLVFLAGVVHVGRTAHARNAQPAASDVLLGLFDLPVCKFGPGGQVHLSLSPRRPTAAKTFRSAE